MPPRVGDDGYAAAQTIIDTRSRCSRGDFHDARRPLQHKHMTDTGHGPDFIQIGALDGSVENRTLLVHGILHARHFDIDAELLLALYNPRFVRIDNGLADDLE